MYCVNILQNNICCISKNVNQWSFRNKHIVRIFCISNGNISRKEQAKIVCQSILSVILNFLYNVILKNGVKFRCILKHFKSTQKEGRATKGITELCMAVLAEWRSERFAFTWRQRFLYNTSANNLILRSINNHTFPDSKQ
jgi:hypothetical protein